MKFLLKNETSITVNLKATPLFIITFCWRFCWIYHEKINKSTSFGEKSTLNPFSIPFLVVKAGIQEFQVFAILSAFFVPEKSYRHASGIFTIGKKERRGGI